MNKQYELARVSYYHGRGYSNSEIGRRIGRSHWYAGKLVKQLGLKPNPKTGLQNPVSVEEIHKMVRLQRAGYCREDIARHLGRSPMTVDRHLRRMGFKPNLLPAPTLAARRRAGLEKHAATPHPLDDPCESPHDRSARSP